MAKYSKQNFIGGAWIKKGEVISGTKAKLVSETEPQPSNFKNDKTGETQMQDVAKIRLEGGTEAVNIALNRATISGLVDAFGEDSKNWIGKPLTVITEKSSYGGKRGYSIYLLAEGYEMNEDENHYLIIVNPNKESVQVAPDDGSVDTSEIPF
jgi:hypothetical protein